MNYDCLIIGHNDGVFQELYEQLKAMGTNHADFRDLNINTIEYDNKAYRVMDIINEFRYDKNEPGFMEYNNGDLIWNTILYLGSFLSKRNIIFDYLNLFQREKEKLVQKLKTNKYTTIVITTTVYTMVEPIMEVLNFIKKYNQDAKIIVGGPFVNKQTEMMSLEEKEAFFEFVDADIFILSREGEMALFHAIESIKLDLDLSKVKNIAYKTNHSYVLNELESENNLLSENVIDYSLFKEEDFGKSINIRISKGCPYHCAFCGFPKRSDNYKYLSEEQVIDVLDRIKELGCIENLFFIDDSVNIPKDRFKRLLRLMIEKNYSFRWNCFFRCDQCDEETIRLLADAKCEGVFLGLESTDETLLRNMNKTSRKEHFEKTIPIFQKYNMTVFVSIFTGFVGETYETFRSTIRFINEMKVDFYRPQLWYCDPVTPIWERREEFGLEGCNFGWKHDTLNVDEACSLNDWAFLCLEQPVWTPDPGFNFISIYYLKMRGFTIDEIKILLRCFNNIAKQKILHINENNIDEALYDNLRYAVNQQLDRIDYSIMEKYSADSYVAAEDYISKEFNISQIKYETTNIQMDKVIRDKEYIIQNTIGTEEELYDYCVSTVSYIYMKLYNVKNINIIVDRDNSIIPVKIKENIDKTFPSFLSDIKNRLNTDGVSCADTYALHVFTHNKLYNSGDLKIDIAFLKGDALHIYEDEVYVFDFNIVFGQSAGEEEYTLKVYNNVRKLENNIADGIINILVQMLKHPNNENELLRLTDKLSSSVHKRSKISFHKDFNF